MLWVHQKGYIRMKEFMNTSPYQTTFIFQLSPAASSKSQTLLSISALTTKMRFSLISILSLASAGLVSALPEKTSLVTRTSKTEAKVHEAAAALKGKSAENESETSECMGPLLCCGSLTTPLDHIVDPILEDLGINAANIVGSIGLLCMWLAICSYQDLTDIDTTGDPYEASSCDSAPQCCTEANLLVSLRLQVTHLSRSLS